MVGTTLYVVQGGLSHVTVITLDPAGTSGVVTGGADQRRVRCADDRRALRQQPLHAERSVQHSPNGDDHVIAGCGIDRH